MVSDIRSKLRAAVMAARGATRRGVLAGCGVWEVINKSVEECTYVANGQSACRISVYSQWEPLEILTFLEAHAVNGPWSI